MSELQHIFDILRLENEFAQILLDILTKLERVLMLKSPILQVWEILELEIEEIMTFKKWYDLEMLC